MVFSGPTKDDLDVDEEDGLILIFRNATEDVCLCVRLQHSLITPGSGLDSRAAPDFTLPVSLHTVVSLPFARQ